MPPPAGEPGDDGAAEEPRRVRAAAAREVAPAVREAGGLIATAADLDAASRHHHLVLYDPSALPPDTPFDPDMEAGEPDPLPEEALRRLAAGGHALVLHYPEEDCEASFRVVTGPAPDHLRERGKRVLERARLRAPGGRLKADGAEFLHGAGRPRAGAEGSAADVPAGDYAVSVFNLIPWKLAEGKKRVRESTPPAAGAADRAQTAIAIGGAVLIPAHVFVVPLVLAFAWRRRGLEGVVAALAALFVVDAVVLGAAKALQVLQRKNPGLTQADRARVEFERENPDVLVCLEPWPGGAEAPAWVELRSR